MADLRASSIATAWPIDMQTNSAALYRMSVARNVQPWAEERETVARITTANNSYGPKT